jgi:mRNA-degrading endonuclease RelE of RelBE toxin-antitoxin system
MNFEIVFSPEAVQDMKLMDARQRATVKDAIEIHLRHEPTKTSKSRIKKLSGLRHPEYRLRIDEIRVFYDVVENKVEVLAIIPKSKALQWLEKVGDKP